MDPRRDNNHNFTDQAGDGEDRMEAEVPVEDNYGMAQAWLARAVGPRQPVYPSPEENSLVPLLQNMQIAIESSRPNEDPSEMANFPNPMISLTKRLIIQAARDATILEVGTRIYARMNLRGNRPGAEEVYEYAHVGQVLDVFGNALQPMYALEVHRDIDVSRPGESQLYYVNKRIEPQGVTVACRLNCGCNFSRLNSGC